MTDQPVQTMTGAEALVSTLADHGVTACFANPGTSEMHLVTALDHEPRIKSTLCLFEGVATGAADGHARVCACARAKGARQARTRSNRNPARARLHTSGIARCRSRHERFGSLVTL